MANSSVVRYMQLFDPIKTVQYFANRGTSGIDGSMSTAVGSAISNQGKIIYLLRETFPLFMTVMPCGLAHFLAI